MLMMMLIKYLIWKQIKKFRRFHLRTSKHLKHSSSVQFCNLWDRDNTSCFPYRIRCEIIWDKSQNLAIYPYWKVNFFASIFSREQFDVEFCWQQVNYISYFMLLYAWLIEFLSTQFKKKLSQSLFHEAFKRNKEFIKVFRDFLGWRSSFTRD
jgi:hypothetical protein